MRPNSANIGCESVHTMKYALPLLALLCLGLSQLPAAVLSCESSPAVEAATRSLNQKLQAATFDQSLALQDTAYHDLVQLDPNDYRPVRRYIEHVHYDTPERFDALRASLVSDTNSHPQDPVKLLAAALALEGKDTPQAFRLTEQALAADPNYAPAYVELAGMYRNLGKFADKSKAATYLEKYYQLCPSGLDSEAMFYLKQLGSSELKAQVAKNLRQRLATVTDPSVLRSYSNVWSLEFSTVPIAEHPKERQRIADDLNRLNQLSVQATAEWLDVLKDGYKESGAPEARVKAIEDRISKEFPRSDEAFGIWYQNWKEQHPQPAGEASAADWQQYMRLALAHYRELIRLFPNEHGFGYYLVEYTSHMNGASNDEIASEGETYIKDSDLYNGESSDPRQYVAGIFLVRDIQPARALALLQSVRRLKDSPREKAFSATTDYAKPKEIEDSAERHATGEAEFRVLYLRACRAAGDKAAAEELKPSVESPAPSDPKLMEPYWNARAILAETEGHNTDALAFYQKALFLREPPKQQYGTLNDRLLDDARRLWTSADGSETAFAIWRQPEKSAAPVLAEGRWQKPDKELPAFELADLQGKTWKLKSLEGKKVLINIWATWCGPCQSELPHLQKLYEQTKGRSDIAIVTLNFDEDLGMVEPFIKKKGFSFPVVPAYAFLANKIDVNSIPRNWLIDGNGKWEWEQIGFDSTEPDWEKSMLSRLEGTK